MAATDLAGLATSLVGIGIGSVAAVLVIGLAALSSCDDPQLPTPMPDEVGTFSGRVTRVAQRA